MDVRTLDSLPVLEQGDFPPLPRISEGTVLLIYNSGWRNTEKEWAAGIIITACVRAGEWRPVEKADFVEIFNKHPRLVSPYMQNDVADALWKLIGSGELDIVQVGDVRYVIPKPKMANIALANLRNLRAE